MWAGTGEHQYHIPMPWLEQQTTVAKEKGAALWHWVTADPYGNFIIKDIRVAEYNHISTQSQVISRTLYPGAYGGPAANCSRATSTQPSAKLGIAKLDWWLIERGSSSLTSANRTPCPTTRRLDWCKRKWCQAQQLSNVAEQH